ncbi:MAG: hypothetical protein AAGM22_22620 [Acidobacteriota bacterium]
MRVFVAVFLQELTARRLMFGAAALLGLLPLLAPWLPTGGTHDPTSLRQIAFGLIAGLSAALAPPILGVSLFSRDLDEGKLSFYFSRPVGALPLWLGKIAAALVLLVIGLGLVVVPSVLLDAQLWTALASLGDGGLPGGALIGYPETFVPGVAQATWGGLVRTVALLWMTVLLMAHAAATLIRVRSPWLALDVALAAAFLATVVISRDLLLSRQAYPSLVRYETGLLVAVVAVLLIAGWQQLGRGRNAPARSRRVLQWALWPAVLAAGVLGWAFAGWVVGPSFDDLESIDVVRVAPDGGTAVVGGPVRYRGGAKTLFAVDLGSGEGEAMASEWLGPSVRFSEDGDLLMWLDCRRRVPLDCEAMARRRSVGGEPRPTGIGFTSDLWRYATVSPSGELLALASRREASVSSVASGQLLGAVAKRDLQSIHFLGEGRLLLVSGPEDVVRLETWDLAERTVEPLMELAGYWDPDYQRLDIERGRVLYRSFLPPTFQLLDLPSGEVLLELQQLVEPLGLPSRPRFLQDGRLMLQVRSKAWLAPNSGLPLIFMVIDPDAPAAPQVTLQANGVASYGVGPEVEPGRFVVALKRGTKSETVGPAGGGAGVLGQDGLRAPSRFVLEAIGVAPEPDWSLWLLDVSAGVAPSLTPLAEGLRPTEAPDVFRAADGALVRWRPWSDGNAPELLLAGAGS